jgi:hypothetical protein
VRCLVEADKTIFRFDVMMNVMATVDELNARDLRNQLKSAPTKTGALAYQLISQLENGFEAEFATTGIEEIL